MKKKDYVLYRKNTPVLIFGISYGIAGMFEDFIIFEILNNEKLPLAIQSGLSLTQWLHSRFIPKNRENAKQLLQIINNTGLPEQEALLKTTKGLSLNDDFCLLPINEKADWDNYNLYDNDFSNEISEIAFTGKTTNFISDTDGSPEYTTDGTLRKSWRRINGEIYLFKAGTAGDMEPYSEFYSSQIAKSMGLKEKSINYDLHLWHNKLCSVCKLFTSPDISYIPASHLYNNISKNGTFTNMLAKIDKSSREYNDICNMIIFDAVISNIDRHYGNFGYLQDNTTMNIIGLSPIFDNGLSLFCYSNDKDLEDGEIGNVYNLFTKIADVTQIKYFVGIEQIECLKMLCNFKFTKHNSYNLSAKRLNLLEKIIAHRVQKLLD